MNQENIEVNLIEKEDTDQLIFYLDPEKYPDGLSVNLNSVNSQNELKDVFSVLLKQLIDSEIELELIIEESFKKGLYRDVCQEYIFELNREIKIVKNKLDKELIGE